MKSLFCVGTVHRWAFCSKVHLKGPTPTTAGWPKTQDVLLYGQPESFQMSLRHYDPDDPQAEPVFGGFVLKAFSKQREAANMQKRSGVARM